jgi:hypothetical protein
MKRIGRPCGFPVSTTWRCTPPPPATLWVFIMILVSADTAADRLATPSRAAINCYWINQEPTCIKSSYTRVGRRTGLPSYIGGRFWEVMWRGGAVRRLRVTNWRRISGEIRRLTLGSGEQRSSYGTRSITAQRLSEPFEGHFRGPEYVEQFVFCDSAIFFKASHWVHIRGRALIPRREKMIPSV